MIVEEGDGQKKPEKPTKPVKPSGGLPVPLPFKGEFRLTQAFGENPFVYHRLGLPGHNGLDLGMPVGQPILAVDDGVIIRVEERPEGFGKHVKVQHKWGQSLYAHLSAFKVVLNQPVKQGDVIGLSGNTGFSTGPHLHFGMRVKPYNLGDGWYGYTNPQRYLQWPPAGIIATNSEEAADRMATGEQIAALAFQVQEIQMQSDLWEEKVMELLENYLPGQLPADVDPMAALEMLLASWADELESLRRQAMAELFNP
jgi:hypothetical protein